MPKCINFNKEENQDRCIFREYPKVKPPFQYGGVGLAYFIYNRNYGWMCYKGNIYNLNKKEQSDRFIQLLYEEGFLYKTKGNYTITDSNYVGFANVHPHILLFFLYYTKCEPLSREECETIDRKVVAQKHD